ncbi:MAG TPA: hypothetical protein VKU38_19700 [Ktedonobacteraceae bacterium]|nr:hypothetical protein [Ktedonobacteraceae bacterium]
MPKLVFSQDCVILDACCIINLYASGHMDSILRSITSSVTVAAYVRDEEAIRIYSGADEQTKKYELIDLEPFIACNLLTIVSPETETENNTFLNFAATLGGGEAITGAIALHRNWSIGSDDRKAIAFFARNVPHLQLISTLELIKHWVDTSDVPFSLVQEALYNMRTRARYAPIANHKLFGWWKRYNDPQ